jgi:hypothetical protein
MMLDVFKGDAFSFTKLVSAINLIPYVPTRLGSLNLFTEEGISTLSAAIEMQGNTLTLVQTAARGAPGAAKNLDRRNVRDFRTVHLPQRVAVMADEIQGLRAFGSEATEESAAMTYLQKKMAVARRDLDITHEWQRMGALKGQVLDADLSVIYNWFTEFGVTQSTKNIALSVTTTKVLQEVVALKRMVEDKLGGVMMSGIRVLCSSEFFDAFTGHPAVIEAYKYQQSNFLRTDNRNGFEFGGVVWEEYRGTIGGTRFIAANKAYAIPEGVPELFKTLFSPAPYMETVNTDGLPFYMKAKNMDYDTGVEWQVQSNPLHLCTRPDAIVELTAT